MLAEASHENVSGKFFLGITPAKQNMFFNYNRIPDSYNLNTRQLQSKYRTSLISKWPKTAILLNVQFSNGKMQLFGGGPHSPPLWDIICLQAK